MTQRTWVWGLTAGVVACTPPAEKVWEGVEAGECVDGADNDEDGATDCDDSDCERSYDCVAHSETWDPSQETGLPESAPTGDADGWDCDDDAWGVLDTTGSVQVADGLPHGAPLCSGDFFLATGASVKWLDTTGEEVQSFGVDLAGSMLELDADDGSVYVAGAEASQMAVVDLETGSIGTVRDLSGLVVDLAVAYPTGRALASIDQGVDGETTVAVVGGAGLLVSETGLGAYGPKIAWDQVNSQVFVGGTGGLSRFVYDNTAVSFTFLETRTKMCSGDLVDVQVSADGAHAVLVCTLGNGGDGTLWDVDPTDLQTVYGQWVIGTPKAAAFSPDSTRLAASDGTSLYLLDVAGYTLTNQLVPDLNACAGAELRELQWSRGGSILYGFYDCADPSPALVTWWVVEDL